MGRKKRDLSYLLPFCYYCDKSFKTEIDLHQHQKAKHFYCQYCKNKFTTVLSMIHHNTKLHQKQQEMKKVPNAIKDRDTVELNIFGLLGVPRNVIEERQLAGAMKYWIKVKEEKLAKQKLQKIQSKQELKNNQIYKMNQKTTEQDVEQDQQEEIQFQQPISFSLKPKE